jgi:flavin reductase (DIM6/NTAB) family NADH-FMN oxidoreductase RutF
LTQDFRTISPEDINDNPFKLVGSDWMLITAGPPEAYNTMTASWGGLGVLWNKNVCWCVIRPVRYTYEFMEKAGNFTLSFFDETYRDALNVCGTQSGRDINKAEAAGLTPAAGKLAGTTYFEQARLVLECRKIYTQDLNPELFLDRSIESLYPQKDYHRMYFGEVMGCFSR